MWSRGTDPDNAAIPYLTAVGDLIGTSLLALSFIALESIGDTSLQNLEETHHHNLAHNVSLAGRIGAENRDSTVLVLRVFSRVRQFIVSCIASSDSERTVEIQ